MAGAASSGSHGAAFITTRARRALSTVASERKKGIEYGCGRPAAPRGRPPVARLEHFGRLFDHPRRLRFVARISVPRDTEVRVTDNVLRAVRASRSPRQRAMCKQKLIA